MLALVSLVWSSPGRANVMETGWAHDPAVTVVCVGDDPRVRAVEQAVAHWNETLEALGVPLRIGTVSSIEGEVSERELEELADGRRWRSPVAGLERAPADGITVLLSKHDFVSFTVPTRQGAIVAVKDGAPLDVPNVLPNVLEHELGHALGLFHNEDPSALMCGRPASCRPELFASASPKWFPLTTGDETRLADLYPPTWRSHP